MAALPADEDATFIARSRHGPRVPLHTFPQYPTQSFSFASALIGPARPGTASSEVSILMGRLFLVY